MAPDLQFMERVRRDVHRCREFLKRQPSGQPATRVRQVRQAIRILKAHPKINPICRTDAGTALAFRRHRVAQFVIVYVYFEPGPASPRGMVSIRAIRHASEHDVLWGVRDGSAHAASGAEPVSRTADQIEEHADVFHMASDMVDAMPHPPVRS